MKAYTKDIVKEVRKSKGKFISILLIVAIGVAFFTGITTAAPIMRSNVDAYYDATNFRDLELLSTLGFIEADVEAVQNMNGVAGVAPQKSIDVLTSVENQQVVVKLQSLPSDVSSDNPNYIDQYRLMDGRLPQAANEAIIKVGDFTSSLFSIGDEISVSLPSGNLSDTLKETTYTIVGIVESPNYLSYELGTSAIGSGNIGAILGIYESNFTTDYYTSILVTLKDTLAFNSFNQEYLDYIKPIQDELKVLGASRAQERFTEIKASALEKIQEAEALYIENKQKFDDLITSSKAELAKQQSELNAGFSALQEGKQSAFASIDDGLSKVATGIKNTDESYVAYENKYNEFQTTKANVNKQIADLTSANQTLNKQLEGIVDPSQIATIQAQIAANQGTINQLQSTIATSEEQLAQTKTQLEQTKQSLLAQQEQLQVSKSQLEETFAQRQSALYSAQTLLNEAQTKLLDEEQKGLAELKKASNEIDSAKKSLNDLSAPEWYVLSREQNYSYMDYRAATLQMESIAKVFPLFFILVAALVCLTTMTRMVDEQRGYIGTLKALGYSNPIIALKYTLYAASAGIIGSLIGAIVGMNVFPVVVYNAWGMMYTLPAVKLTYDLGLVALATLFFTVVIVLATLSASYQSLKEHPSSLMRPKAPTVGKRILLERLPFIWNRLTFSDKVTARNIFRYKKRFFMSILGIAGCFALLLSGFGIRDSISGIIDKQFGGIQTYQGEVLIDSNLTPTQKLDLVNEIQKIDNVADASLISVEQTIFTLNNKEQMVSMFTFDDQVPYQDYFNLTSVSNNKALSLRNDGVLISEKLAKTLHVGVDDSITFTLKDQSYTVKVSGVFTNYVNHYMLMSEAYYETIFGQTASPQTILLNTIGGSANENAIIQQVNDLSGVLSTNFYSRLAESFSTMLDSLNIVVLVLIISAGLLAFVVLYNLTTVNVSERLREIATIKVLGFYDKEVERYVFKENIVLTIIGSLVGSLLGVILHRFIMNIVEQDTVIFDKVITWPSYLYSFAITLFFAYLVNLSMKKSLHKIAMVESLKSVE